MGALGAVDLGATHLRAAVGRSDAEEGPPPRPVGVERRPTPTGVDGDLVADAAADALEAAAAGTGLEPSDLEVVAAGSVGPLDRQAGAAVDPPNLPGAGRIPLRSRLVAAVGHDRVIVENDAVAGLVGERAAMADPPGDLVYLTLSTGVGAGVAVDGRVLLGRDGNATEVGHLVVDPQGRRCGCGGRGHWEAYAGGAAIPELARELGASTGMTTRLDLGEGAADAIAVFAAADAGDPLATRVVERAVDASAVGLADVLVAYAPARVVIGGAVALENPAALLAPLRERTAAFAMGEVPPIRPAALGGDAVLRGALELARIGGLDGS